MCSKMQTAAVMGCHLNDSQKREQQAAELTAGLVSASGALGKFGMGPAGRVGVRLVTAETAHHQLIFCSFKCTLCLDRYQCIIC